jgi:hypothetical protein
MCPSAFGFTVVSLSFMDLVLLCLAEKSNDGWMDGIYFGRRHESLKGLGTLIIPLSTHTSHLFFPLLSRHLFLTWFWQIDFGGCVLQLFSVLASAARAGPAG